MTDQSTQLAGALALLLTHVYQMRGAYPNDRELTEAINEAETALATFSHLRSVNQ